MRTSYYAGDPEIPPTSPPEAPPVQVPPGIPPGNPVEIPEPPQEFPPKRTGDNALSRIKIRRNVYPGLRCTLSGLQKIISGAVPRSLLFAFGFHCAASSAWRLAGTVS